MEKLFKLNASNWMSQEYCNFLGKKPESYSYCLAVSEDNQDKIPNEIKEIIGKHILEVFPEEEENLGQFFFDEIVLNKIYKNIPLEIKVWGDENI